MHQVLRLCSWILLICFAQASNKAFSQQKFLLQFPFNAAVPEPQSLQQFKDWIAARRLSTMIRVTGHTDLVGPAAFNNNLSARRTAFAAAVLREMYPSASLILASVGSTQPVSHADSDQYRNRRVEIIWGDEIVSPTKLTSCFVEPLQQQFPIDLGKNVSIVGARGIRIEIPARTICDGKGRMMSGEGTLYLKEFASRSDILLSGMHTQAKDRLLQTGGMFEMFVVQGNDTGSQACMNKVEISFPVNSGIYTDMHVFRMNREVDSLHWVSDQVNAYFACGTRRSFGSGPLLPLNAILDLPFENWETGKVDSGTMKFKRHGIFGRSPETKWMRFRVEKEDSSKVNLEVQTRFRNRGRRRYKMRQLDSTLVIDFRKAYTASVTGNLRMINCDRFYDQGALTSITVTTPAFEGVPVLAFFPSLNAFMRASDDQGMYQLRGIPAGVEVKLVAFGRDGGQFYFGETSTRVVPAGSANIELQMVKDASTIREKLSKL